MNFEFQILVESVAIEIVKRWTSGLPKPEADIGPHRIHEAPPAPISTIKKDTHWSDEWTRSQRVIDLSDFPGTAFDKVVKYFVMTNNAPSFRREICAAMPGVRPGTVTMVMAETSPPGEFLRVRGQGHTSKWRLTDEAFARHKFPRI